MKTVLLIDSFGSRFFQRRNGLWHLAPEATRKDSLWVLLDLPEETLEVIDIPRLFGSDRSNYIERRLNNAIPDSPYRASHPLSGNAFSSGKIMLNGIGSSKDIEAVFEHLDTTLVGVWSMAALLALMSRKKEPPDVMLVLPGEHQLRIVVMKDRIPVLTRCVHRETGNDAKEILLTRQYLENQRILERGKTLPLLFLGDTSDLATRLNGPGITLLTNHASFNPKGEAGWRHLLFERLIESPPCQLAPLPVRAHHVAASLRLLAYLGTIASVAAALFINEAEMRALYDLHERNSTISTGIQRATSRRQQLTELIHASGADPDLVRRATQFESREIRSAPGANDFLKIAAAAIFNLPNARIHTLSFHALQDSENRCISDTPSTDQAGIPTGGTGDAQRYAEIKFTVGLPGNLLPREKTAARQRIADSIQSIKDAQLLQNPLTSSRNAILKGGVGSDEETTDQWCLSIPWKTAPHGTAEKQ